MKVAAQWPGIGLVFLAVDRSYARPEYYWSTEVRNAEVYPDGDPAKKVRSQKLRDQVTDIQAVADCDIWKDTTPKGTTI